MVLLVVNMAAHNSRSIPSGVSPPIVAFFSHVLLLLLLQLLLVRFCVVRTPGFSVSGVSLRFLCVYVCVYYHLLAGIGNCSAEYCSLRFAIDACFVGLSPF